MILRILQTHILYLALYLFITLLLILLYLKHSLPFIFIHSHTCTFVHTNARQHINYSQNFIPMEFFIKRKHSKSLCFDAHGLERSGAVRNANHIIDVKRSQTMPKRWKLNQNCWNNCKSNELLHSNAHKMFSINTLKILLYTNIN